MLAIYEDRQVFVVVPLSLDRRRRYDDDLIIAHLTLYQAGVAIAFFQPSTMDGTSSLSLDLASLGGEL